jgi:hypothetical protein
MGNDVPGGARSRVCDPVRWKDGKDKWAQKSRAGGGAFRDKVRDAECGRCAAELTLDQPLNGLRRPLSSRFRAATMTAMVARMQRWKCTPQVEYAVR